MNTPIEVQVYEGDGIPPKPVPLKSVFESDSDWILLQDHEPPYDFEVLVRGYVGNNPKKGFWHQVLYFKDHKWYTDEEADEIWKGHPPIYWRTIA